MTPFFLLFPSFLLSFFPSFLLSFFPSFSSFSSLFSFRVRTKRLFHQPKSNQIKHLRAFQHFLPKLLDIVILLFSVLILLESWFLETGEGCEVWEGMGG